MVNFFILLQLYSGLESLSLSIQGLHVCLDLLVRLPCHARTGTSAVVHFLGTALSSGSKMVTGGFFN